MFKTRLISTIVISLFIIWLVLFAPTVVTAVSFLVFSIIGYYEFEKAVGVLKDGKHVNGISFFGYLATISLFVAEWYTGGKPESIIFTVIILLIVLMGVFVFAYPTYSAHDFVYTFFGFIYVSMMLSFFYLTLMLENGRLYVMLIPLSSWVCDVCAYCVGMLLGKHKLTPKLSPKKSVEGAVGGVIGSAVCGALCGYLGTGLILGERNAEKAVIFAVICAFGAIASQIGDLTASAFKRQHDIKDYGNLIPGHGGILDRFDSVIITGPIIYILSSMLW